MPNTSDKLERQKATDPEEQIEEGTPVNGDEVVPQEIPEPVQEGNLGDADRSKLVEDPTTETGTGGRGRVAELRQKFESPAQPEEKPQAPPPGRSRVAELRRKFEPPAQPAAESQTPPASVPPEDKYALLKRDINSLTDEEKEERAALLEEKYVVDWKKAKEQKMDELTEDLGDDEKSKEETRKTVDVPGPSRAERALNKTDDILDVVDFGADVVGAGFSLGTNVADTAYSARGVKDHKATSMTSSIADIGLGGYGLLSGGYRTIRSGQQARQKHKKGDKRGAKLAGFDLASNLFGSAGGALGMSGGIAGLAGADAASDWLGHASAMAGIGGSLTGVAKGFYQRHSYGKLAGRKETEESKRKTSQDYINSREKYKQMKGAYARDEQDARSKENRMEMLKQRHNYKRSKDFMEAMDSAREHAKIKSKAGKGGALSGALGALGGGMGLAGGLARQFGGLGGKIANVVLGGIGSLVGFGTKALDLRTESKEKKARKAANDAKGKEYIEKKVFKLILEAQEDHVTGDEAKLIIAKRLGVDDPSDYAEVYKKLSERRADRILNREEGYQDVLAAMGLTEDADKATILEALGVS